MPNSKSEKNESFLGDDLYEDMMPRNHPDAKTAQEMSENTPTAAEISLQLYEDEMLSYDHAEQVDPAAAYEPKVNVVGFTDFPQQALILTGLGEFSGEYGRCNRPCGPDLLNLLVKHGVLTEAHADAYVGWLAEGLVSAGDEAETLYKLVHRAEIVVTLPGGEERVLFSPLQLVQRHTTRPEKKRMFASNPSEQLPLFAEVESRVMGTLSVQAEKYGLLVRNGEMTLSEAYMHLRRVAAVYQYTFNTTGNDPLEELFLATVGVQKKPRVMGYEKPQILAETKPLRDAVKAVVDQTTSMEELRARLCQHGDCNHAVSVVDANLDIFSAATFMEEARINDVLRALPMINRYTGQTIHPYSVAQHSMVLTRWACEQASIVAPHMLMAILLHDAAEAFIGDIIRPIKRMVKGDIRELEAGIITGIYYTVIQDEVLLMEALDPSFQEWVHQYDTSLAATEALTLQRHDILPNWDKLTVPAGSFDYIPWSVMHGMFCTAFSELRGAMVSGVTDASVVVKRHFNIRPA